MSQEPSPRPDSAVRLVISALLVITGVAGLLASLCGGFFTWMFLTQGGSGAGFLAISLPSLVIGGTVAWACYGAFARRRRRNAA